MAGGAELPTVGVELVPGSSSTGTVTSVSVVSANGFAGTVATPTTTPAITISTTVTGILSGDGTAISAASTTGTGAVVLANTPTLITPILGVATGTSLALNGATIGSNAIAGVGQFASFGATTTGPGFYSYLTGDTVARVRIGLDANDMPSLAFGPGGASVRDAFILRAAAASIQFGQTDLDTTPVAQTARSQGTLAGGTSNVSGANWTFIASPGKGTGTGGSFIFQTAPAGSTGTTVNAPVTALTIDSTQRVSFSGNGAASVSPVLLNGTLFTGVSATTTFPQMLFQPTGTSAVTSWSTSGTVIGANVVSGFAGNFYDFHTAGGGSLAKMDSAGNSLQNGNINTNGRIFLVALGGTMNWRNGGTVVSSPASASLQLGDIDAASSIAQTLRVQSVVAGTSAANGANWTLIGSLPTGTGTSGDIIVQTGVKTGSGTTQGTATTALTIKGETQTVLIASGKQLQLGNTATTGLAAGVLAATTNATITLTDASGQVYRIPCII